MIDQTNTTGDIEVLSLRLGAEELDIERLMTAPDMGLAGAEPQPQPLAA